MNKTVQTVLTVLCALMILTLPFLVPSPKLLLVENLDGAYEVYIKQWNHMVP